MKLLFDQNISHRIVPLIEDIFPDSLHIKQLDMETANDTQIWEYARENQFTIISKDSDFHQRSFVFGSPPKVIWIKKGNCSTEQIVSIVRNNAVNIKRFIREQESAFLILE